MSASLPLVSIIIPCYNQASFLPEAIESILNQTYPNYEIVVIDDGSPDNVEEVAKQYTQVKLIKQKNQGAAIARNKGITESKGSYLIFLDADDKLLPNAVEVGVQYLTDNTDCSFVSGRVKLIDQNGSFIKIPKQLKIEKDHFKSLLEANYIWTPGVVMYRRAIFDQYEGFSPNAGGSADYELNVRIARLLKIASHGEIVLEYRVHQSNMSKNFRYMLQSGIKVRRKQFKYIKHDPSLVKSWKAGIELIQKDVGKKLIRQMLDILMVKGFNKDVFVSILNLIKYYPKGFVKFFKAYIKVVFKSKRFAHS